MGVMLRTFRRELFKLFLLLLCALACQEALACDTKLPPVGPRLFRAKAYFGEVMRMCQVELVAAAKELPSEKLRKTVQAFCHILNVCKESLPENAANKASEILNHCIDMHTQNKTGILYSELGLPYVFGEKVQKILECFRDKNLTSVPYEVGMDAISFASRAALTFGLN